MYTEKQGIRVLMWIAIPFYIWTLVTVNLIARNACCNTIIVSGINIVIGIQFIVGFIILSKQIDDVTHLFTLWLLATGISTALFITHFSTLKAKNCHCYRKYKVGLTALTVISSMGLIVSSILITDDLIKGYKMVILSMR